MLPSVRVRYSIDIPDIMIIQTNQQIKEYKNFDLDTSYWRSFDVPTEEIVIESLKTSEVSTLQDDTQLILPDTPQNMILSELLSLEPGMPFRLYKNLLYKITDQAIEHIRKGKTEQEFEKSVWHYRKDIAQRIWEQLDQYSELSPPEYEVKLMKAATPILQQEYTKFKEDEIIKYTTRIPEYEIRKKVVGHFEKACHTAYKFESVPEHIFSIVLERSKNVQKWLRPALDQFKIYYGSKRYQPDFVVETYDSIYIVEIKSKRDKDNTEVKLKAKAAREYCNNVNAFYAGTDKKPWKYMFLLEGDVQRHTEFSYLEKEVEWWAMA